jgi:hypothetical protein
MSDNAPPSFLVPYGNDVSFEVEGTIFYGKRNILAKKSRFFAIMFNKEYSFKESTQDIKSPIHIGNLTASTFWIVMAFVCTGKLQGLTTIDEAFSLFSVAEYLMFPDFDLALQIWIGQNLQNYSVCEVWNLADSRDHSTLSELCLKFFIRNFAEVVKTIGFLKLKKCLLKQALATGDIQCSAEFILNALKGWARYQMLNQDLNYFTYSSEEKIYQFLAELLPPNTFFNYRNKMCLLQCYTDPVFA